MSSATENRPSGQSDTPGGSRAERVPRLRDALDLPATVDLPTAGAFYGMSPKTSYDSYHANEFPVRVLKLGSRYRVRSSDLLRDLGTDVLRELGLTA
jgi:hypothetical protein